MEYLMSSLCLVTDHSESLIAALAPKKCYFGRTYKFVCPARWLGAKILVRRMGKNITGNKNCLVVFNMSIS
jgi:hypothetical protein